MREAQIERACCAVAGKEGWLSYKWASPGQRGVPDRIFIRHGRYLLVEFKRPGNRPTKLQRHTHAKLRAQGAEVVVIDSVEAFRDAIA